MSKIQIISIIVSALIILGVFELIRQRKLIERYSLLWLLCGFVLLALSIWRGLLEDISRAVGIFYPPSALFVIAVGFIILLLLHFSIVISRLADQTKMLAQRLAMLEQELRTLDEHDLKEEVKEKKANF